MVKLNLGSGILIKKGFWNVDLYKEEDLKGKVGSLKNTVWEKGAKYVQADIRSLPFKNNSVDYIEAMEVIEHLPYRQVVDTLKEIRRVMKKGARLLMTTPNFDGLMKDWLEVMTVDFNFDKYFNVIQTIYGAQTANGEFHNSPFNSRLMNYYLTETGFKKGKMFVVPKHGLIPVFGSTKWKKGAIQRNETLYIEVYR